jgi:hypothetical protein
MDGATFELPLFLLGTFAGAVVAGPSGFAFGLSGGLGAGAGTSISCEPSGSP